MRKLSMLRCGVCMHRDKLVKRGLTVQAVAGVAAPAPSPATSLLDSSNAVTCTSAVCAQIAVVDLPLPWMLMLLAEQVCQTLYHCSMHKPLVLCLRALLCAFNIRRPALPALATLERHAPSARCLATLLSSCNLATISLSC